MADEAMAVALRLLGRRDHSTAELRRKLEARGYPPPEAERVLARLSELNYLNDRRLAERLAASFAGSGRCLGRRLELELRRRGIPQDLAADATAASRAQTDEVALARDLLARRYPTYTPAADNRERRRVMAFLQRRGFSSATVWQVLSISPIEGTDDW